MEPEKTEASRPEGSLYSQIILPTRPPESIASTFCRNLVIEQRQNQEKQESRSQRIDTLARTLIERLELPGSNPVQTLSSLAEEIFPQQISPAQIIERALALPEGRSCQQVLNRLNLSLSPEAAHLAILILSNKASFAAQRNLADVKATVSQLSQEELRSMLLLAADKDKIYRFGDHNLICSHTIRMLLDCQPPTQLIPVLERLHLERRQMLDAKSPQILVGEEQIWAPAIAWAIILSARNGTNLERVAQLYQNGDISVTRATIAEAAIQEGLDLSQLYKQEVESPAGKNYKIERGIQALKHLALGQQTASLEFITSVLSSPIPQYAFQAAHLLCQETIFGVAGRERVVEIAWSLFEDNRPNPVLGTLFWAGCSARKGDHFHPTYNALVEFLSRKPFSGTALIENLSRTPLLFPEASRTYMDVLKHDSIYMQVENISLNTFLARYFPVETALTLSAAGGILGENAERIFSVHCERLPKHTASRLQNVMTFPSVYPSAYQSILRIAGMPSASTKVGP